MSKCGFNMSSEGTAVAVACELSVIEVVVGDEEVSVATELAVDEGGALVAEMVTAEDG